MPDACDVCGADDRPVERTTAETIAPVEADLCRVCQLVQDHEMPEGRCAQCGDALDGVGFHLEVEFPLGPDDGLLGDLAVDLCAECSGWAAHRINYQGVAADEVAHQEYLRLIGADEIEAA